MNKTVRRFHYRIIKIHNCIVKKRLLNLHNYSSLLHKIPNSTSKQLSEIKRMVLIKDFPFFKEIKYFSSISHKITIIQD